MALGRSKYPGLELIEGDAENLPFANESLDGVLLSGLVHHFPDPRRLAAEVRRVLKPGGRFVAFDPNRMNPFMWLYRDRASPFYSPVGVTENERPVLASRVAEVFRNEGFRVQTDYLAGLAYRYVASPATRTLLPIYNFIDATALRACDHEAVPSLRADQRRKAHDDRTAEDQLLADAPTTVENADVTVVGGAGHVGVPLVLALAEAGPAGQHQRSQQGKPRSATRPAGCRSSSTAPRTC